MIGDTQKLEVIVRRIVEAGNPIGLLHVRDNIISSAMEQDK